MTAWIEALRSGVYPRACGGTLKLRSTSSTNQGLSPRLRGNHRAFDGFDDKSRSIPAPAGEPYSPPPFPLLSSVYPRACGGTADMAAAPSMDTGLSPRLRGNLYGGLIGQVVVRSIPAPAGEPGKAIGAVRITGVYPRACGGTLLVASPEPCRVGLSPRLRGNP